MGIFTSSPEGWGDRFQNIEMNSLDHTLVFGETSSDVESKVTSRILFVNPGITALSLFMPDVATSVGGPFYIINTTTINAPFFIFDDAVFRGDVALEEGAMLYSDGIQWHLTMLGNNN